MIDLILDAPVRLVFSDGLTQTLDVDLDALGRRYFSVFPPGEAQWEEAIMTVEDAIAPVRDRIVQHGQERPSEHVLRIEAAGFGQLAQGGQIRRATAEQVFQQLSRYGRVSEIPEDSTVYARFLLVREFLHHMDFDAAIWQPTGAQA